MKVEKKKFFEEKEEESKEKLKMLKQLFPMSHLVFRIDENKSSFILEAKSAGKMREKWFSL